MGNLEVACRSRPRSKNLMRLMGGTFEAGLWGLKGRGTGELRLWRSPRAVLKNPPRIKQKATHHLIELVTAQILLKAHPHIALWLMVVIFVWTESSILPERDPSA